MTCKDKLLLEYPDLHYIEHCPDNFGYMPIPEYCHPDAKRSECEKCWSREIPTLKDSGNRREFESGAVRDIQDGKGRCDLMPLDVVYSLFRPYVGAEDENATGILYHLYNYQQTGNYLHLEEAFLQFDEFDSLPDLFLELAKHFEDGAKKYGENNWQKGIPTHCYIDSAVRHYLKYLRGDKDEPHARAFVWNIMCCIWTCLHKPELNDYRKDSDNG